jgi:hypothetical protein
VNKSATLNAENFAEFEMHSVLDTFLDTITMSHMKSNNSAEILNNNH